MRVLVMSGRFQRMWNAQKGLTYRSATSSSLLIFCKADQLALVSDHPAFGSKRARVGMLQSETLVLGRCLRVSIALSTYALRVGRVVGSYCKLTKLAKAKTMGI